MRAAVALGARRPVPPFRMFNADGLQRNQIQTGRLRAISVPWSAIMLLSRGASTTAGNGGIAIRRMFRLPGLCGSGPTRRSRSRFGKMRLCEKATARDHIVKQANNSLSSVGFWNAAP